jgi:hypothetical protein
MPEIGHSSLDSDAGFQVSKMSRFITDKNMLDGCKTILARSQEEEMVAKRQILNSYTFYQ